MIDKFEINNLESLLLVVNDINSAIEETIVIINPNDCSDLLPVCELDTSLNSLKSITENHLTQGQISQIENLILHVNKIVFSELEYSSAVLDVIQLYSVLWQDIISHLNSMSADSFSINNKKAPTVSESSLTSNFHDVTNDLGKGQYDDIVFDTDMGVSEFCEEISDILEDLEKSMMALEQDLNNPDHIDELFRLMHTVKGTAGFLSLEEVCEISHISESLLAEIRKGRKVVSTSILSVLFGAVETLAKLISNFKIKFEAFETKKTAILPIVTVGKVIHCLQILLECDSNHHKELLEKASWFERQETQEEQRAKEKSSDNDSVKVPSQSLDAISEIVGELSIGFSRLRNISFDPSHGQQEKLKLSKLTEQFDLLDLIIGSLQHQTLSIRMYPISNVYHKLNRQIRKLKSQTGKDVDFVTKGGDTQVDKQVVDRIFVPLIHMIRNSMDHGIESSSKRKIAKKSLNGTITVSAENKGDTIEILVIDDGGGLDLKKIRNKAEQSGIINSIDHLSELELGQLIFHPGLSTSEQVSQISGRGFGMDIVQEEINSLGGHITVSSTLGEGSTFKIELPLSTSIIDGLVTKCDDLNLVFPLISIEQVIDFQHVGIQDIIDRSTPSILFRNKTTPIICMNEYWIGKSITKQQMLESTILIYNYQSSYYGLIIDSILYKQKVVCKTMHTDFIHHDGIKAGTILPDGKVGYIIDPIEIISQYLGKKGL